MFQFIDDFMYWLADKLDPETGDELIAQDDYIRELESKLENALTNPAQLPAPQNGDRWVFDRKDLQAKALQTMLPNAYPFAKKDVERYCSLAEHIALSVYPLPTE